MKKIILLSIIIIQSCIGFSQEEPKEKISQVDVFAVNTFFGLRLRQTILNQNLQFQARIRQGQKSDFFVGRMIPLDKRSFAVMSVGVRYTQEHQTVDKLVRVEIRSKQSWGMIRVNYGLTNFVENGVSANVVYNIIDDSLRAGIASSNQYFGPRIEASLPFGQERLRKSIRFQASLLSNSNILFGIRIRFGGKYTI